MDLPVTSSNYHQNYAFSQVLNYFSHHRHAILSQLINGTIIKEHFCSDRYCQSQYSPSQKCVACHLLGRVFPAEELYQHCRSRFTYQDVVYQLTYYRANQHVSYRQLATSIYHIYGPFNPPLREHAPITSHLICLDTFTLQAVMSWILSSLNIPHHHIELIYYCNNRGYRLAPLTSYLTYDQLRAKYDSEVIYRVISCQLKQYYRLLRGYCFYGGGLTINKLWYRETGNSDNPFVVEFNHLYFGECGITYGNHRICNIDSVELVHRNPIHQVPAYQFHDNTLYYQLNHLRSTWHALSQVAIVDGEPYELHGLITDWVKRDPSMTKYITIPDYIIHDHTQYLI